MSHWERRELLLVSDTIRRWLIQQTPSPAQRAELVKLLQRADQGSKTVRTDAGLLSEVRSGLCAICASEQPRLCNTTENAPYCDFAPTAPKPT